MNISEGVFGKSLVLGRRFWLLALIVFAGRIAWWLYWGTLLEIDSLGYLELQTTLYHPPLYSVFNALAMGLGRSVDAIVVLQSLLYSIAVATVLQCNLRGHRWKIGMAIALALEPCSGKLACTVMAETLFLSLLLLSFAVLQGLEAGKPKKWMFAAFWIGWLMGLAHLTRYAAPVFLVAVVVWMVMREFPLRRVAVIAFLLVVSFQVTLLPLRFYYHNKFGTLQTNAFSSLSLWNTTAYLYPGSALQQSPRSDFEDYLQAWPDSAFAISETWHTNQMFHDSLPFQRFVKGRNFSTAEVMSTAQTSGKTGWRLLSGAPLRHLEEFVWPNVQRPFWIRDRIHSDLLAPQVEAPLHRHFREVHDYWPGFTWILVGLLLGATAMQIVYRKRMSAVTSYLVLACWLYLAGIGGLAVIFLRFVYVLAPLIFLVVGLQAAALSRRENV